MNCRLSPSQLKHVLSGSGDCLSISVEYRAITRYLIFFSRGAVLGTCCCLVLASKRQPHTPFRTSMLMHLFIGPHAAAVELENVSIFLVEVFASSFFISFIIQHRATMHHHHLAPLPPPESGSARGTPAHSPSPTSTSAAAAARRLSRVAAVAAAAHAAGGNGTGVGASPRAASLIDIDAVDSVKVCDATHRLSRVYDGVQICSSCFDGGLLVKYNLWSIIFDVSLFFVPANFGSARLLSGRLARVAAVSLRCLAAQHWCGRLGQGMLRKTFFSCVAQSVGIVLYLSYTVGFFSPSTYEYRSRENGLKSIL